MNFFKLTIICRLHVKCVRSHYGMYSSHHQLTNAKGNEIHDFHLNFNRCQFFLQYFHIISNHKIRCRNKIHKEHVDNNDPLAPCKLHHDPHSAREMLLLATSNEDQKGWVNRLSKRIQKCGYKANSLSNNNSSGIDGNKISSR